MVSIAFSTLLDRAKPGTDGGKQLSAIHSGNGGDILYSLPAVKALGVRHFILNVFRSPDPLRKLTQEMAFSLVPLLLEQDYIDRVTVVRAGLSLETVDPACIGVDYLLDRFRLEDISQSHLMYAHARATGARINPNVPFLSLTDEEDATDRPDVVLAITPRYRVLTDEFIRELALYFENMVVLAIPEEWRTASGIPGGVRQCADILEMARIIRSARLFIGNPSLASAVAEGLKAPRLVDLPIALPNAFPIGPHGYVLPGRRAEFLDVVRRLCGDNLRIASLYRDLMESISRLNGENARLRAMGKSISAYLKEDRKIGNTENNQVLSLVSNAQRFQPVLQGGTGLRIDPEAGGILLHPGPVAPQEAQCLFSNLDLTGYDCFEADIALEHAQARPVLFSIRIYDSRRSLIVQSTKEVDPATRIRWTVPFGPGVPSATLKLTACMADQNASSDFAWAWVYDPVLKVA